MISYKATIAYDGTPFFGWQKTVTGPSVQEKIEDAISRLTQEKVVPEAASRTDRGVHAEGQVIGFSLQKKWDPNGLQRGINAHLPPEIRILDLEMNKTPFHPTLDALGKEYHYRICCGDVQDPIHRLYSWHFRLPLDLALMREALFSFIGTRDFSAFANEKEEKPICTLKKIEIEPLGENRLQIALTGDRFLYKMARTLAGTLLYIGCGKLLLSSIGTLFVTRKRELAGVTAPAHGLFLHQVFYV